MSELQVLDLRGTKITDDGLERLEGLTALRNLDLRGTKYTRTGLASLFRALPRAKVLR
jgi:hypothetical protein